MSDNKTDRRYKEIGKMLTDIVDASSANKSSLYRTAFLKGLFSGVGGVIGATLVVALLLWLLSLLGEVPLLGRLFESLEQTIDSSR